MIRFCGRAFLLLAIPLMMIAPVARAQHDHKDSALPKSFNQPMLLVPKALGTFTRPISSSNKDAQAYFNQGIQLMYAFDMEDAARSFHEAENRDPNCAICFWGE